MKSELVVDVNREEVSIALLEDSRLVSLQKENRNIAYAVGDLYLAKVKKIMPGLNAAFVDVGYEKDAFLHYLDLGPQYSTYTKYIREALSDKKKIPNLAKFKFDPDIPKRGKSRVGKKRPRRLSRPACGPGKRHDHSGCAQARRPDIGADS